MEQERVEYHVKSYRTDCNCQRLRGRFSTPEEAALFLLKEMSEDKEPQNHKWKIIEKHFFQRTFFETKEIKQKRETRFDIHISYAS